MNRDTIEAEVRSILAPFVAQGALDRLPPQETYLQSLGIESADLVNVIVEVEDTFGFEIDLQRLGTLLTLADLIAAVEAARP